MSNNLYRAFAYGGYSIGVGDNATWPDGSTPTDPRPLGLPGIDVALCVIQGDHVELSMWECANGHVAIVARDARLDRAIRPMCIRCAETRLTP